MPEPWETCGYCDNLPRFEVALFTGERTRGRHYVCGRHLVRAIEYVTLPGGSARVQRLS